MVPLLRATYTRKPLISAGVGHLELHSVITFHTALVAVRYVGLHHFLIVYL